MEEVVPADRQGAFVRSKSTHRCPNRREFKAWLAHTLIQRGIELPPTPSYRDYQRGLERLLSSVGGEP